MTKHRLKELLEKLQYGELDSEESNELDSWYKSLDYGNKNDLRKTNANPDLLLSEFRTEYLGQPPVRKLVIRPRFLARAAAVAGFLLIGGVFYFSGNKKFVPQTKPSVAVTSQSSVEPGSEKAILILADGSRIDIDKSKEGVIADQGLVQVIKDANGLVRYEASESIEPVTPYNTIVTPRGGEYHLILPDGTHVWLNASSSITFPARFHADERRVSMSGEVYYEVARMENKPFIVSVNSQEIKVLGTHFNINAYADEGPEKVTLLEGAVQVSNALSNVRLRPGQQSYLSRNKLIVEDADVEQAIAWKSGFFELNHSSLETIMRAISRWYDVDVEYEGTPTASAEFGGRISKRVPLATVLDVLRSYGIECQLQGKKIIVRS